MRIILCVLIVFGVIFSNSGCSGVLSGSWLLSSGWRTQDRVALTRESKQNGPRCPPRPPGACAFASHTSC